MMLLGLLLALDAALHFYLIYRFGLGQNVPFLIVGLIDAALALAVFFAVPYAVWATLALCALAFVGLAVTFKKAQRDKTVDRVILVLDPLIILYALYLLFVR